MVWEFPEYLVLHYVNSIFKVSVRAPNTKVSLGILLFESDSTR